MKKKIFILSMTLLLLIGSTTASFATENSIQSNKDYEINSVNELKSTLDEMGTDKITPKETKALSKETDPAVIKSFITEKDRDAERILQSVDEIIIDGNQNHYEKTYDIGDNCWIKFEVDEQKVPTVLEAVKDQIMPSAYALSRSGHKTGWQKYGNWSYTAKTTVNYGVASGTYSLRDYYKLSSKGIKVTDEMSAGSDSGLLRITEGKLKTTDDIATKPGASDCDTYAQFKTTYGKDPIQWSRNHIMRLKIKYLGRDTKDKKIHSTRSWSLKSL